MNKKEIAKEFTRQMLDQNTPSINFEQVASMLKQIEQTNREVLNDMDSYRIKHRSLAYVFTDHHSQLKSLELQVHKLTEALNEQLSDSSTRLSKFRKSSLWQRYWTAVTVAAISALLTNVLLMML
jgi:hypothetical protein